MSAKTVDRDTFLRHLRKSGLLTKRQYQLVVEKLGHIEKPREIAKALASWKLLTKFQASSLLSGRRGGFFVGPYRILDEVGRGAMGRVYKAVHESMKRVVALKILSSRVTDTERALALFRREVQTAARLNHPNIVMAFDAAEAHGRQYLAMEYVQGPNLEQYVAKHGPVPIGQACEIIYQAAAGLQHAHEEGIVHRDIKPANLLLQPERNTGMLQVKILDFGLSSLRWHGDGRINTGSSKEHAVMGTPDFLSPEQARHLRSADIRSDLYSLGCTFYYLLTGQVPFPGGGILEKLTHQEKATAKPVEEIRTDTPRSVAKIVRKLMEKNPADRFQTPGELLEALAAHAEPSEIAPFHADADETTSKEPTVLPMTQDDTVAQPQTPAEEARSFLEDVNQRFRDLQQLRRSALPGVAAVSAVLLATWPAT